MGKKSPSPPPAPDPYATANAQSAANKETAIASAALNRINEVSPYGTLNYSQTGYDSAAGVPLYTRTTTLNPQAQDALNKEQQLTSQMYGLANDQFGRVSQTMATPFSFGGAPGADYGDLQGMRQKATDSAYGQLTSRLDPRMETEERRMRTMLANQGFVPGGEGYDRAFDEFNRAKTDAYGAAQAQAQAQGGQEFDRMFSTDQANRQQWINEQSYLRNLPINEITALLGTGGVQQPQFSAMQPVSLGQTDVTGPIMAQYQGQMNAYNNQMANRQATMGSLYGLGGALGSAAIMACDRALKENNTEINHTEVLESVARLPVESWNYKGDTAGHIGPYAQDFKELFGVGDGKTISVVDAFGVCLAAIKALTAEVRELKGVTA